jgi:hypothetical protein
MHGVIVFSTRSGACLFARAFTENFGLPGEWSTHGDGASTSPTGRSFGAMQLAGLLFAIRAYAEDLHLEDRGRADDIKDASERGLAKDTSRIAPSERRRFARPGAAIPTPSRAVAASDSGENATKKNHLGALRRWVSGDVSIAFAEHACRGIAVALFAHADLGASLPARVAGSILDEFARKHDGAGFSHFGGAAAAPSKSLTFAAEVVECVLAAPAEVARELAASADVGSTWVYVALEEDERESEDEDEDVRRDGSSFFSRRREKNLRWFACLSGGARREDGGRRPKPFRAIQRHEENTRVTVRSYENERRGSIRSSEKQKRRQPRPRLSFVASCAPKFVATTESKWRLPLSESTADAVAAAARNIFRLGAKSFRASEELPAEREANASIIFCGRFAFDEEAVRKGSEETQETRGDVYVYAFRVGRLLVALPDETGASYGQTVGSKSSAVAAACVGGRVAGDAKRLARLMAFAKTVDDAKGDRLAFAGAARLDQSTKEAEAFH